MLCCLVNTDAVNRTNLKRSLSCSLDSSTINSALSSPKCITTSLNDNKQFVDFCASSTFPGSLLSPSSSSSEMLVSSPVAASNSYATSTLNSPSTVFSSCMFPEIPAFSPSDSALSGCETAHVPASGPAYVGCSAASVGVSEGAGDVDNGEEGDGSMTATTLKRSLSGTFREDGMMTRCASKRTCSDNGQQTTERSTGYIRDISILLALG